MALRPQGFDEEDDEDLEALRLAALQTLKAKTTSPVKPTPVPSAIVSSVKTKKDSPTLPTVSRRPRNDFIRGGMHRGRHRNAAFQRHRVNPNLIAIVPIRESSPPSSSSDLPAVKATKPSLVVNSASPKLILPQDRYCKTEEVAGEKQPEVSTKFDRFEHSSSESSAEDESADDEEEEEEKEEERVGAGERQVEEAKEEDAGSDAEPDPDVLLVKDEDDDDSLEKLMNEMEEELAGDDALPPLQRLRPSRHHRLEATADAALPSPAAAPGAGSKTERRGEATATEKQPSPDSCGAELTQPVAAASSVDHRTALPPSPRPSERRVLRSRSRSRSPPLATRRDTLRRSRSPLSLSPLPRRKSSYSPVAACSPSPCRRSRSPRSPRRSRSPLARARKYSPVGGHSSPRRRASPRRLSPSRWGSPRRQSVSPNFRRQSVSPGARGPRRSVTPPAVSTRRPSPVSYRRRTPSPPRRNQSPPPRRYSPPRRNPSPPRRRSSRSPLSPPRRRRLSPTESGGRKLSPWSPVRVGRSSPLSRRSPPTAANAYKRKSPSASSSPYGRRRRSDSPGRRGALDDKRLHRVASPVRGRRPLQESRLNNIRRSCSPSGDAPDSSPPTALPPSPSEKNWSCTSSLSLSPSPERAPGEAPRRVRSPLRVRKRNDFTWDTDTAAPGATAEDQVRKQSKRRKEKSKSRKHRTRVTTSDGPSSSGGGGGGIGSTVTRSRTPNATVENATSSVLNQRAHSDAATVVADSVLEARRRKFESALPIESSNKKIRLRKDTPVTDVPPSEPQPPTHSETLPQTEDLEELLDLELENAVDLWGEDDSDSDEDPLHHQPPPSHPTPPPALHPPSQKTMASAATNSGRQEAKIRVVPLYKLQGLEAKPLEQEAKGGFRMNQDDDWEQPQLKTLEASFKDCRSGNIGDRTRSNDSLVENERETFSVSDKLDLEQRRSRMDLLSVNADVDESSESGSGKDGDLRAELSRRRAERLTMAGSVHETLPTRLVQSAFKDAVGKKNFRKLDRERHCISKRSDNPKGIEGSDGRRVLVLKSPAVEQQVPSISVTIPKEEKHKRGESPVPGGKLPIHMRLGLPGGGGGGFLEAERERQPGRRGSRKVKLKRNVLLASPAGEKVMCGSSLSLTLGSMRHSLLCSVPTFPSTICGLRGIWSDICARLSNVVATRQTVQTQDTTECEISIQGNENNESYCFFLYRGISQFLALPQLILKNHFHSFNLMYP